MDLLVPLPPDARGREPDVNAFVELHNLVAAAEHVYDVGPADTARISRERGVDLNTAFRDERVGLYVRLFEDAGRTPDALVALGHVAHTLALDPADVRAVHTAAFGTAVEDTLADDCLTVAERMHLYALQGALGLDEGQAAHTVGAQARARLLAAVARALCDGRLSPDEAAGLAGTARALGVTIPAEVARMLSRAASAWEAAAPLPVRPASVRLSPGESEHVRLAAQWARKRTDSLAAALADGVRAAPTHEQRFPWGRFMAPLRRGDVVLTSTRLVLLDAERATEYVPLRTVAEVVTFADALVVRIEADSRRLVLAAGAETLGLGRQIERALADLPQHPLEQPGFAAQWRAITAADPNTSAEDGWEIPGDVSVTDGHLVLAAITGAHEIARTLITEATLRRDTLRVELRDGTGWLVRFADSGDADEIFGQVRPLRSR